MFDNYQIFNKYAKFLGDWRKRGKPKLYVATMDIRKCYDSVDIKRLINMIQMEQFFEEQYIVHGFTKVIRSKRYLFSKKLEDVVRSKVPTLEEVSRKAMNDDVEWAEKRKKFEKRGNKGV